MLKRYVLSLFLISFAAVSAHGQSFTLPITVSDGTHSKVLNIGLAPGATDGYDSGMDTLAPPPPPGGAFDARLKINSNSFFTDIRDTNRTKKTFYVSYTAAQGDGPIILRWDPARLNSNWTYTITDDFDGTNFSLDMSTRDSLDVSSSAYLKVGLRIVVTPTNPPFLSFPVTVSDGTHNQLLTMGMAIGASNSYDQGLDVQAPPQPPSGAFDARLSENGQDYFKDYRDTSRQATYVMSYAAATGDGPITLSWDKANLMSGWNYTITDDINGTSFILNMRTKSSLDVSSSSFLKGGLRVILSKENIPQIDLYLPITVSDGAHKQKLTVGTAASGTDGYDPGLDTLAPPPPPSGAFDARLKESGQDYFADYRDTSSATKTYVMSYAAASGDGPITLSWKESDLKPGRSYIITDDIDGKSFSLDMSTKNSLDVSSSAFLKNGLRIVVGSANHAPIVTDSISDQTMMVGDADLHWDLSKNFRDPDGDNLTYQASSSDQSIATATVNGTILSVHAVKQGQVTVTVTADDGRGGSTQMKFSVKVQSVPVPPTDKVNLYLPITVSDGVHDQKLTVGTAAGATDGFDSGLDTLAPPPPPSGAFDARLSEKGQDYFADYRDTTDTTHVYVMSYAAATGDGPITLSWDPSRLKSGWSYEITDDINGTSFSLDMRTKSSLDVSSSAYLKDGLRIVVSQSIIPPPPARISLPVTVSDGVHQQVLAIGMAAGATNGYDPGLDTLAPPPPPSGAFDARLKENGQDYFADYRDTTDTTHVYVMSYAAATGDGPITLSWDPSRLKSGWSYEITDNINGTSYSLDMSTTSSLDVSSSAYLKDGLRVVIRPNSRDSISFGKVTKGHFSSIKIPLYNRTDKSLRFRILPFQHDTTFQASVGLLELNADTTLKLAPHETVNIEVTFRPASNKSYVDTLRIDKIDEGTSDHILLMGQGVLNGLIINNVPDGQMGFGTVDIGRKKNLWLVIQNETGDSVRISNIIPYNSAFSIDSSYRKKIDNGDTIRVKVAFNPQEVGIYKDDIFINTAEGYSISVTTRGIGTAIENISTQLPNKARLFQNYPNPFNPTTTIRYSVPKTSHVRLEVFNILGQRVASLVNKQQTAGYHNVTLDASRFASGMYLYRIQIGDKVITKKMMLLK